MRKRPQQAQPGDIPRKDLKFVLYARKSTDESSGKQIHSIQDQVDACKDYAAQMGDINIIEVITEQKSAKYSHKRPEFRRMIRGIKNGTYDAIIAFDPDRLARNMLEAGEIIDMLTPSAERGPIYLKDLVFPNVTFNNDTGGRLTLAVLFSLATQYSENLSARVAFGHQKNLQRGSSAGTPKWGYIRDADTGHYQPSAIFDYIKKGWEMLLAGESKTDVLKYFVKNKVRRYTKTGKLIEPTKQILTSIFTDRIAYGILEQGGKEVDLCKVQPDFQKMITLEEFEKVQQICDDRYQTHNRHSNSTIQLPLDDFVFCAECGSKMYPGASGKKDKKWVYYNCQNKQCTREHKGVRANIIFDDMYEVLKKLKIDDEAYEIYSRELDENIEKELNIIRQERRSLAGARNQYIRDLKAANENFARLTDPKLKTPDVTLNSCREEIEKIKDIIDDITADIEKMDEQLNDPDSLRYTKEDFLNLFSTSYEKLKDGTFAEKDAIAKSIFLNCEINDKNEISYLCKPEFEGLITHRKVHSGGSGRT